MLGVRPLRTRNIVTATAAAITTPAIAKSARGRGGTEMGELRGFTVACSVFEWDNVPFVTVRVTVYIPVATVL